MSVHLDGSTVLITGASSGLGVEFATQLAPRAKALILLARRGDKLEKLKAELGATSPSCDVRVFSCDITNAKRVDEVLSSLGFEIDVLINNAVVGDYGRFETSDWSKQEQMIALNITALSSMTHKLLPAMVRKGSGGILMVSSAAAFQAVPGLGLYSATKYFVSGFADVLRAEVGSRGVVITHLCPGPTETDFSKNAERGAGGIESPVGYQAADICVRQALHAFENNEAVVVTGLATKVTIAMLALTPSPLKRLAMSWYASKQK